MADNVTLSEVVGANVRRLRMRAGATQDATVRAIRERGMKWSLTRQYELEAGQRVITVVKLLAVADALGDLSDDPVRLADLMVTDQLVELTPKLTESGDWLQRAVGGAPVKSTVAEALSEIKRLEHDIAESVGRGNELIDERRQLEMLSAEMTGEIRAYIQQSINNFRVQTDVATVLRVESTSGLADKRAARSLGHPLEVVWLVSAELWGRSVTAERDARVGPDANAQHRGIVTRQLLAELRQAIESNPRIMMVDRGLEADRGGD